MSKQWPKSGTLPFDDLSDAVLKAINELYTLKRKTPKDIKWTGPPLEESILTSVCIQPENVLTIDMLEYEENDQGRKPIEVLIGIAIQLGIEQGIRIQKAKYFQDKKISELMTKMNRLVREKQEKDNESE